MRRLIQRLVLVAFLPTTFWGASYAQGRQNPEELVQIEITHLITLKMNSPEVHNSTQQSIAIVETLS